MASRWHTYCYRKNQYHVLFYKMCVCVTHYEADIIAHHHCLAYKCQFFVTKEEISYQRRSKKKDIEKLSKNTEEKRFFFHIGMSPCMNIVNDV